MTTHINPHAKAAQDTARRQDGKFGNQQHTEATGVSLAQKLGPSVTRALVVDRVRDFATPDEVSDLVPVVRDSLGDDLSDMAVDEVISKASRDVLGRDVIVHRDLAYAGEGVEMEPMNALRAQNYLTELESRQQPGPKTESAPEAMMQDVSVEEVQHLLNLVSTTGTDADDRVHGIAGRMRSNLEAWTQAQIPGDADGSFEHPVHSNDPRVQAGEVFDNVTVDGTTFSRRRDGVYPTAPYALRIQADRPLDDEQMLTLAGVTGYAMATAGRGEVMSDPERDSPYSFVVHSDTTKGGRYRHLDRFEENLGTYIEDGGSPIRKKDGLRAIEMPNAPKIEIYYDSVEEF